MTDEPDDEVAFELSDVHDAVRYVIRLGEGRQYLPIRWKEDVLNPGLTIKTVTYISGAVHFDTYDRAEECLAMLIEECGLDRAAAAIEVSTVDREFRLRLYEVEDSQEDDYIAVIRENGTYFIEVMNIGNGAGDEIPVDVAEPLLLLLGKIDTRLRELRELKRKNK